MRVQHILLSTDTEPVRGMFPDTLCARIESSPLAQNLNLAVFLDFVVDQGDLAAAKRVSKIIV